MEGSVLYKIIEGLDYEKLPTIWKDFDINTFSYEKSLFPYQREALQNAVIVLQKYFQNIEDQTDNIKKQFLKLAENNGLSKEEQETFFASTYQESSNYDLLSDYFKEENNSLPAWNFINRMSFWMATGSGKSLVLIKIIELLQHLMKQKVLVQSEILFLTHRPDLIDQLKEHIDEFNVWIQKEKGISFLIRDLRDFPEQQRNGDLFKGTQINIYYYLSDLISNVQKENIIDFKNYENNGNWYVILDEAHRGDSEESKRKQFYKILSRNGFLFNFSATFTDEVDILTTVYNLNLAEYIKKGFGKHLYIFQEQFKYFKRTEDDKDFIEEEKQKIVLMSIILLTYLKLRSVTLHKNINKKAYHNPLLLTLVNSVSATDSDLYLFFNELQKIASNKFSNKLFKEAKKALTADMFLNQFLEFEKEEVLSNTEINSIMNISIEDILKQVFNTNSKGDFEVSRNPKNKHELSFRVKSGAISKPFALIKIGDVSEFEKNNLSNYDIEENYDDISLFENIDDSSINILMGSRAFYVGWDSNRPNIINFVNIGTQAEAKKFILQSIGRGIRIEPLQNKRKRLLSLINDGIDIQDTLKGSIDFVKPIETLFIFGTNQKAIQSVLNTLKYEQVEQEYGLDIFDKENISVDLLIPVYKEVSANNKRKLKRLEIHEDDFELMADLISTMDYRALLLNYNFDFNDIEILNEKNKDISNFKKISEEKIGNAETILKHVLNYYKIVPEEVSSFKMIEDEIEHYNHIKVKVSEKGSQTSIEFKRLDEFINQIKKAKNPIDLVKEKEKLKNLYKDDLNTMMDKFAEIAANSTTGVEEFSHRSESIEIKKLVNHYYFPSIISKKDRIKWMKHIIDIPSEIEFINFLERYLQQPDNLFKEYDWWMFSKIDHTTDKKIRIPYIDPINGKRDFLPDFVFWFQKGDEYNITYIDPKGTGRNEYQYKVDGYRELFEENDIVKVFKNKGKKIKVNLRLATEDKAVFAEKDYYKNYWIDINEFTIC